MHSLVSYDIVRLTEGVCCSAGCYYGSIDNYSDDCFEGFVC